MRSAHRIRDADWQVPGWLPRMLHEGNSAAAIIDLLLAHKHRTFSWRASSLTALSLAAYCSWLPHSFHVNGSFPYPFMYDPCFCSHTPMHGQGRWQEQGGPAFCCMMRNYTPYSVNTASAGIG